MLKSSLIEKNSKGRPDYFLLGAVGILLLLGILILASVSASFALKKFEDSYHLLKHQLIFGLIPGLVLGFVAFKIKLDFLKKISPALLLLSLVLMVMVFLPFIGSYKEESARWIGFGFFSFQPSEILKLTFILYLASWLASRTPGKKNKFESNFDEKNFHQTFLTFLMVIGVISLLLIFQPDISTLGVIVLIGALMYFLAETPLWHFFSIIALGAIGLFALIKLAPYRAERLLVFLHPEAYPMDIGYQIKQALIAIGSGGVVGMGFGMSVQKLGFLPQSVSDSIFAVFSEETGFIGGFFLIILFLLFAWRGFYIAKQTPDRFSQLTALGITSWIIIQTFVNIGAMIGLLPLTGIPLPFISYGGSALVSEMIGVGILLNISRR